MASTVRIRDLTVNRLGFGAMRVCGTNIWGPPKNRPGARAWPQQATQIALAWLRAKSPVVLPIPGTADLEHLEENAGAAQLTRAPDEMRELN